MILTLLAACASVAVPGTDSEAPYVDTRPANPTCLAPDRPQTEASVALEPAFDGRVFSRPTGVYPPPTPEGWWTTIQQKGRIYRFKDGDPTAAVLVADLSTYIEVASSEEGLLGLAYAPDFVDSGRVYLSYTALDGAQLVSRIARVLSHDGGLTFDLDSLEVLLQIDQPYANHNGGNLAFGPDGYLYAGYGDGGSAGDPNSNGQNPDVLLGKMLRLDVSGPGAYTIPADNPFAAGGGAPEVYAWGLRNPWRWAFDPASGELWVGDVGQNAWEELDRVERGGNYGWNTMEGAHCFKPVVGCDTAGLVLPVAEYAHGAGEGASIVGGPVYRGSAIPGLVGAPLFADVYTGVISAVTTDPLSGAWVTEAILTDPTLNIVSFAQDAAGEVYVVTYAGTLWKLVPAGEPGVDTFPTTLSATGCFHADDPTEPVDALLPYDVNVALWSDGADKRRWFALPDGGTVTVGATGDLDLPVGSVVAKEFWLGDERVETRLLVRHDDGYWAGYSYQWNDAGTDAALLPAGATHDWAAGTWTYPSRAQCLQCHSEPSGRTLGLTTAQLNGDYAYPWGETVNQLDRLGRIGVFADTTDPTAVDPAQVAALPRVDGDAPVADRARAWLDVNCAHCHQPGGGGLGALDLRYATPMADAGLCGAPENGDLGVPGALIVSPGRPEASVLSLRLHATDANRMPAVATHTPDPVGTALVDAWITGMEACP